MISETVIEPGKNTHTHTQREREREKHSKKKGFCLQKRVKVTKKTTDR